MNVAQWEKENEYTNQHNCSGCKHSVGDGEPNKLFNVKLQCLIRKAAGAGYRVKRNYWCKRWEGERK